MEKNKKTKDNSFYIFQGSYSKKKINFQVLNCKTKSIVSKFNINTQIDYSQAISSDLSIEINPENYLFTGFIAIQLKINDKNLLYGIPFTFSFNKIIKKINVLYTRNNYDFGSNPSVKLVVRDNKLFFLEVIIQICYNLN